MATVCKGAGSMTTKHFADKTTNDYIGGFGDGAQPPKNSYEVPPPPDARMRREKNTWVKKQELIDHENKRNDIVALLDAVDGPDNRASRKAIKKLLTIILEDTLNES